MKAIGKQLGPAAPGRLAYARCLPREVLDELCPRLREFLEGWRVHVVCSVDSDGDLRIPPDRAVELREDKAQEGILLLVDPRESGPGMASVFSAAYELEERPLLKAAESEARELLPHGSKGLVDRAMQAGRRARAEFSLSPWVRFDFLASCADAQGRIGACISKVGLWPIQGDLLRKDPGALEQSALVVQRLLLSDALPRTRVATLRLTDADREEKERELAEVLRQNEGHSPSEALSTVVEREDLWLGALHPDPGREVTAVKLRPLRQPNGNPYAWSGLTLDGEGGLRLVVPSDLEGDFRFEVRWETEPDGSELPPGAANYLVEVLTVSDVPLASRTVSHASKTFERCRFDREDFGDLDEDGKWDVVVRVSVIGGHEAPAGDHEGAPLEATTDDITLLFGEVESAARRTSRHFVRTLADHAIRSEKEEFDGSVGRALDIDSEGCVSCVYGGRRASVKRPVIVAEVEKDWSERDFALGRWTLRVREDGSPVEEPQFIRSPLADGDAADLLLRTRRLSTQALVRQGFVGLVYRGNQAASDYVNGWSRAVDRYGPELALANTVEVLGQREGQHIGLIVLPSHFVRVAWHQAYDELAYHVRYEEKQKATDALRALGLLDGSHYPMFLPGVTGGPGYVFGDALGFHLVAMVPHDAQEPQASIAQLARAALGQETTGPAAVGDGASEAIASEIIKYCQLHSQYRLLKLNALRPGDGRTVSRALGRVIKELAPSAEAGGDRAGADGGAGGASPPRFELSLYPSAQYGSSAVVGRFLTGVAEGRRVGSAAIAEDDRWILETTEDRAPRLVWARRGPSEGTVDAAHLSVAFDTFDSTLETIGASEVKGPRPREGFGLFPSLVRVFSMEPEPHWLLTVAAEHGAGGDKHPAGGALTDRLLSAQAAAARATATALDGDDGAWPVLKTSISAAKRDDLLALHESSDWVITADRHAGIEYFDAPKGNRHVYESYVIDCVPERSDLDTVRLITSTIRVSEVTRLLTRALDDMGLTHSPRNSEFLLGHLKALSGRLAMRFTQLGQSRGELIALAMVAANSRHSEGTEMWLPTSRGFFVPLDDVRDVLLPDTRTRAASDAKEPGENLRADLMYVSCTKAGGLGVQFVEVKYRRLLRGTRATSFLDRIVRQTSSTRDQIQKLYFDDAMPSAQRVLSRRRFARALQFYLDKALRHGLSQDAHEQLARQIDALYSGGQSAACQGMEDRGYVFCPEWDGPAVEIDCAEGTRIFLFGPDRLPDAAPIAEAEPASPLLGSATAPSGAGEGAPAEESDSAGDSASSLADRQADPVNPAMTDIDLGAERGTGDTVKWRVGLSTNPHLMIVGKPGMGKTTSIVNSCLQFRKAGVVPVVFAYHADLADAVEGCLGASVRVDTRNGLGFNPMRVVGEEPHAWLDNVGMLRDIIASIYPELGERQTAAVRSALKESYLEVGYGQTGAAPREVPELKRFLEIIRDQEKRNQGLIDRLEEVGDYGLFETKGERSSLLEADVPVVVGLHHTQNERVQNFLACFTLLSIYQSMMLRGPQDRMTHVVVFDEAHRASRLKLLPAMAKECRKFGLCLIVASQEARDFDDAFFSAIANYLVLNVADADAATISRNAPGVDDKAKTASRLKHLDRHRAMFFTPGTQSVHLDLMAPPVAPH